MANQNQNGRNIAGPDDDRSQDEHSRARGGEGRIARGDDDRDDGSRSTERYGQGQSGYGSGRFGDDRSLGHMNRNQGMSNRGIDDRQGIGSDDRFSSRGGSGYWQDRGDRQYDFGGEQHGIQHSGIQHPGYNSGYNQGGMGYGGYGQQGMQQHVGSQQGFRGGSGDAQMSGWQSGGSGMYGHGGGSGYYGQGHQGHPDHDQGNQYGYGQQGMGPGRSGGYAPGRGGQFDRGMGNGYGHQGMQGSGMQGGGMHGNSMQGGGMQGMRSGMQGGMGMHRGKGPQGYTRSDERIREQVCEVLSDDDNIDATHIEVVVKNGEVLLTGTVVDRHSKRLAEDLVERCAGVKDVQNQIRVQDERQISGRGNQNGGVGKNETETSTTDKKHRA